MEIKEYLENFKGYLNYINEKEINEVVERIYSCYKENRTIFVIGNGGSASNASHLAQDLSKGAIIDQKQAKRIKAMSLSDNISYITAVGNDDGFENIFTSQLRTFSKEGDLLIAISCSGTSKNIVNAAEYAKAKGIEIIGITGFKGGTLKQISDYSIHIPLDDFGIVEAVHSVIFHYLVIKLRERLASQ